MISIGPVQNVGVPAPAPTAAAVAAAPAATKVDPQVAEAAKGFEGVFMQLLVNEMFKGTEVTQGNAMYSGLMTQQLSDSLAASGGFGFAQMLTKQLEEQS